MKTKFAILTIASVLFNWHYFDTVYAYEQKSFVIIIPSYKNAGYYEKNLNSVFAQKYQNYRVIYIDDASPDKTARLVENYVNEKNENNRVMLIKNTQRVGALANIYNATQLCLPDEILVFLDGDDALHDADVLSFLNGIYQNPNVWMTYGQYMVVPQNIVGWSEQIPQEIINKNGFRTYKWVATHLRTCRAGLFHAVKKEDLLWNGNFWGNCG